MEDDATQFTQQATQQYTDERRLGQGNSGLSDDDAADIICVLIPLSANAHKAADFIYKANPRNTIETGSDVHIRQKEDISDITALSSFDIAAAGLVSCGIALRLSAKLKDPFMGFQFGRHTERCDFPIGQYSPDRRVSHFHFRIYINEHCVIMIEDQSTNGTLVDRVLLRAKDKENNAVFKHTIEHGQKITLTGNVAKDDFTFLVWIPNRSDDAELAYQQNVTTFFLDQGALRDQRRDMALKGTGRNGNPPNLFPNAAGTTPDFSPMSTFGKQLREWRGGNKYNKVGQIGKGAFAIVYKVTSRFDGTPYAAKELEKRRFMKNGVLDQKVDMEMRIMRKINHPNIVKYIEHIDWDDVLILIMEFIPGGDLGSLINLNGYMPEQDVKDMASQLLSALGYLHSEGITHRDVKPDNILINRRSPLDVKLTDFGLSKVVESEETFLRTFCGTLLYCAPEVYTEYREYDANGHRTFSRGKGRHSQTAARYGHAVDVWSLAGVLFFAFCGSPPYPTNNGSTYMALLHRVMTEPLDIRPLQLVGVSDKGIRFVRTMLHIRPEHRATVKELQESPWLTGEDNMDTSMEESYPVASQLDQETSQLSIKEKELEQGASQLSIADEGEKDEGVDVDVDINQSVGDVTDIQGREVPYSFSDANINGSYDYRYTNGNRNPQNGHGRLFGEIVSASSGAIPLDPQMNLPLPTPNIHHGNVQSFDTSYETNATEPDGNRDDFGLSESHKVSQRAGVVQSTESTSMAPPNQPPIRLNSIPLEFSRRYQGQNAERATRSSSLMGAESMVGQLNMDSPASATSPGPTSPPQEVPRELGTSLRRPREESADAEEAWQPVDLPAKRRRRSEREIDLPVPTSIFWDPSDKSTHHHDYPQLLHSDYKNLQEWAKSKGEEFKPGHKSYEQTMRSFRTSRSPSNSFSHESQPHLDNHAQDFADNKRHMLLKRDDRNLESQSAVVKDTTTREVAPDVPVADFQRPKPILARFISTSDSCIPNLNLIVNQSYTSWGRDKECTIRFLTADEVRVPKIAFKLMLFALDASELGSVTEEDEDKLAFFISTKASQGILINDFELQSYKSKRSIHWGQLQHGDIITVWRDGPEMKTVTKFKFECYFSMSKHPRKEGEKFQLKEDNPNFLVRIDDTCDKEEKLHLKRLANEQAEQKKVADTKRNDTTDEAIGAK